MRDRWIITIVAIPFALIILLMIVDSAIEPDAAPPAQQAAASEPAQKTKQTEVEILVQTFNETGVAAQRYIVAAVKTEDALRSGKLKARAADDAHKLVQQYHLPNATLDVKEAVEDIRQLSDKDIKMLLMEISG